MMSPVTSSVRAYYGYDGSDNAKCFVTRDIDLRWHGRTQIDNWRMYQECNLRLCPINKSDCKIEVQKTTLCFFSINLFENVKNEECFLQLTELKSSWKVIIHCQLLLSRIKNKDHLKLMLFYTSKEETDRWIKINVSHVRSGMIRETF